MRFAELGEASAVSSPFVGPVIDSMSLSSWYDFVAVYRNVSECPFVFVTDYAPQLLLTIQIKDIVTSFDHFTLRELRSLSDSIGMHLAPSWRLNRVIQQICVHVNRSCEVSVLFRVRHRPRLHVGNKRLRYEPTEHERQPKRVKISDNADDEFPVILSESSVRGIIRDFQRAFDPDSLLSRVCAVCGERLFKKDVVCLDKNAFDFALLANPDLFPYLLPNSYNLQVYSNAILHPKGMHNISALASIDSCRTCSHHLCTKKEMPPLALANWFYYGFDMLSPEVKQSFDEASLFERVLIARCRASRIVYKFSQRGYNAGDVSNAAQGYSKGNVCVLPHNTTNFHSILPPRLEEIGKAICALFVSHTAPTHDNIRRLGPFLVDKDRVSTLIEFLIKHNTVYLHEKVSFSEANLDAICTQSPDHNGNVDGNSCMGIEISHLETSTADDVGYTDGSGDYTDRNEVEPDVDGIIMDGVGYTDGQYSMKNLVNMKLAAVKHCVDGGKFVRINSSTLPISDRDPTMLTSLFPHLDPWAIGGFNDPRRKIKVSFDAQVKHMLKMYGMPFATDPHFAFVCFNIIQRRQAGIETRFKIQPSQCDKIVKEIELIDPQVLRRMHDRYESQPYAKPDGPYEEAIASTISRIQVTTRDLVGSNGHKLKMRNEIRALIMSIGTPTLFLTINPADIHTPIMSILTGEHIDPEYVYESSSLDLNKFQRMIRVAKNPAAAAVFFDLMITNIIENILRYGKTEPGLFGPCTGYYGTVEAQGRGTLHCHMLIWIKGNDNPSALTEKLISDGLFRDKMVRWVDSIISCQPPGLKAVDKNPLKDDRLTEIDPRTCWPPDIDRYDVDTFRVLFKQYVNDLVAVSNWHIHTTTCWKKLATGEPKNDTTCRMRMDGVTRELTEVDPSTGEISIKRLHPYINPYNDVVAFSVCSNTDLKLIGSGIAANAVVYYATDYITKAALPAHAGLAALIHAIRKHSAQLNMDAGLNERQNRSSLLTKCVNAMNGKMEMSHQQIMSYLVGGGDHYTSHKFSAIRWSGFDRRVRQHFEQNEENARVGINVPTNGELPDPPLVESTYSESWTAQLDLYTAKATASDQVDDYMFRGRTPGVLNICLYDFAAFAYRTKSAIRGSAEGQGCREERFDTIHPLYQTHVMHIRNVPYVPVLYGKKLPKRQMSEGADNEMWFRAMLILFKPWRNPSDLKGQDERWGDAFNRYVFSDRHTTVMRHMNVLHECKEARDNDMTSFLNGRESIAGISHLRTRDGEHLDNDIDEYEGVDAEDHDVHDDDVSFSTRVMLEHMNVSTVALDSCLIGDSVDPRSPSPSAVFNDAESIDITDHIADMSRLKLLRRPADLASERNNMARTLAYTAPVTRPSVELTTLPDDTLVNRVLSVPSSASALEKLGVLDSIVSQFNININEEQERAFRIIGTHMAIGSSNQLTMYVGGVGGTGKSHIINALVELFDRCGEPESMVLTAPTGIAALLIGGYTIHSMMSMRDRDKSISDSDINQLHETWRMRKYIAVDEVSMVGVRMLNEVCRRLKIGKLGSFDADKPFGGMNVIFFGDFGQLKPVGDRCLFARETIYQLSASFLASLDGQDCLNGLHLWYSVQHVVLLKQSLRHFTDPRYAALIARIRVGSAISEISSKRMSITSVSYEVSDYRVLRTRILDLVHFTNRSELSRFIQAPFIVGTRRIRNALNDRVVKTKAERLALPFRYYHSKDIHNRVRLTGMYRNQLWEGDFASAGDALGKIPMVIGTRVMFTENYLFAYRVANGTEGIVVRIYHESDGEGIIYATCVHVYVKGCGLHLHGIEEDVVPVYPINRWFSCKTVNNKSIAITRKQIPLIPSYSYTDYKAQGRTLDHAIVDLASSRNVQSAYVMLSRIKALSGLLILRDFPSGRVEKELSSEFREEFKRLRTIDDRSKNWYNMHLDSPDLSVDDMASAFS